jgi:hypothetical protein
LSVEVFIADLPVFDPFYQGSSTKTEVRQ